MSIQLKVWPPAIPGASYARILQCLTPSGVVPTEAAPGPFVAGDALTATVSLGQGLPSLFGPAVTWANAPLSQVTLVCDEAQTAMLAIDAQYLVEIFGSRAGVTYPIAAAYLPTLPAAGTQAAAAPPDLITIPYAAQLLAILSLSESELETIPTLITGWSGAVRTFCNRLFTQGVYVETLAVQLDGTIRLSQIPIQQVQRIQCQPQQAITIGNPSSSVQQAWVYGAATGSGLMGWTLTSLTLNWTAGGAFSTQAIPIAAGMTIDALAAAINAVGDGWGATTDPQLGLYAATDLMDALEGKGAGPGDLPDGAAVFRVYTANVSGRPVADGGMESGFVEVGRIGSGYGDYGRWGPGLGYDLPQEVQQGRVRCTYQGGFAQVPADIQRACLELVKVTLERLGRNTILKSENADKYSYTINEGNLDSFPPFVRGAIRAYQVSNA